MSSRCCSLRRRQAPSPRLAARSGARWRRRQQQQQQAWGRPGCCCRRGLQLRCSRPGCQLLAWLARAGARWRRPDSQQVRQQHSSSRSCGCPSASESASISLCMVWCSGARRACWLGERGRGVWSGSAAEPKQGARGHRRSRRRRRGAAGAGPRELRAPASARCTGEECCCCLCRRLLLACCCAVCRLRHACSGSRRLLPAAGAAGGLHAPAAGCAARQAPGRAGGRARGAAGRLQRECRLQLLARCARLVMLMPGLLLLPLLPPGHEAVAAAAAAAGSHAPSQVLPGADAASRLCCV